MTAVWSGESATYNGNLSAKSQAMSYSPQPNEFDLKRIERALVDRKRYRYVSPTVQSTTEGYLISSPCCSRNIDPEGGVIDIARLEYLAETNRWRLYHKDHKTGQWHVYEEFSALAALLALLREDPDRRFWQ